MTDPSEPEAPKPLEPMPSAPALDDRPPDTVARPERPKPVNMAFFSWLVMCAFLLLGVVLLLVTSDADFRETARDVLEQQGKSQPTDKEINDTASGLRIIGLSFNIVMLLVIAALVFPMRAGKNWARITLTAFGALLVLLSFLGGNLLNALVGLVVIGAAVVLMYRKDSNAYFAANRPRRL